MLIMLCKINSMIKYRVYLVLVVVLASMNLFGQGEEINYHAYKNEIGIDIQNILSSGVVGATLVFKHRKPETGLIALNEKTAYRFRLSLNGDIPIGQNKIDTFLGGVLNFFNREYDNFNAGFSIGIEKQINRKRLQYCYGLDLGYAYNDFQNMRYYRITSTQSGKSEDIRRTESQRYHGPTITPFFGFKFFIIPEISLSIESGLVTYFNFIRVQVTEQVLPNQDIETVEKSSFKELGFNFDYLRTLNLSYYF